MKIWVIRHFFSKFLSNVSNILQHLNIQIIPFSPNQHPAITQIIQKTPKHHVSSHQNIHLPSFSSGSFNGSNNSFFSITSIVAYQASRHTPGWAAAGLQIGTYIFSNRPSYLFEHPYTRGWRMVVSKWPENTSEVATEGWEGLLIFFRELLFRIIIREERVSKLGSQGHLRSFILYSVVDHQWLTRDTLSFMLHYQWKRLSMWWFIY